jgi:8-oxo-dGTP pyrophosphatase MutT (NUDIX family)
MAERKVTRAIITNEVGNVLLGKRGRGVGENQWALVGGKPDPGETEEQAVIREVREELRVGFVPSFYKQELDTSSAPGQQWQVYYYTGPISGEPKPDPEEIIDVTYASRQDLETLDIAFDHRERLIEFFEHHGKK